MEVEKKREKGRRERKEGKKRGEVVEFGRVIESKKRKVGKEKRDKETKGAWHPSNI